MATKMAPRPPKPMPRTKTNPKTDKPKKKGKPEMVVGGPGWQKLNPRRP